jgi:hypothetical protein
MSLSILAERSSAIFCYDDLAPVSPAVTISQDLTLPQTPWRQFAEGPADYETVEQVLDEAHRRVAMRTVAWCVLPNHWHLVLWPRDDDDLPRVRALVDVDAHPPLAFRPPKHRDGAYPSEPLYRLWLNTALLVSGAMALRPE